MKRCDWCESDELYIKYHDEEWGVPAHDDIKHFEFLILEGVQAGLSWLLVLKKKSLFPVIFAHALNNIISAHAVWNYLQGNDFALVTYYMYIPLMIIGLVLFIWQFSTIKTGVTVVYKDIGEYFKPEEKLGESKGDVYFRILIDLFIGIIILALGLFIFGV